MDWLLFISNNDTVWGALIGLLILFGVISYMAYYFISNIYANDNK